MGIMLPTATDNGGRLAAILPTGLLALAKGAGLSYDGARGGAMPDALRELIPSLRSLIIVAVDGLGSANLKSRAGHAPTIMSLPQRRITTVSPSTTAAALTTLTTGTLPAEHGLVGYRIMHEQLGLLCPLRDWDGIDDVRGWQLAEPLFHVAERLGVRAATFGRPGHAESGFTRAILTGAEYRGGERIADRFAEARRLLQSGEPVLGYVYVDELDRVGHKYGWESDQWVQRLEQLDAALADFLTGLPAGTGIVLTADHGMVDIAQSQQIVLDLDAPEFADVGAIGGEPRFRSFFLHEGVDAPLFASQLEAREGKRAWVTTREAAFAAGLFGPRVSPGVVDRVGDVILAARGRCAYYLADDDPQSFDMVGQHGSWTDEEQGIPLVLGRALAGSGFARAVEMVSDARLAAS